MLTAIEDVEVFVQRGEDVEVFVQRVEAVEVCPTTDTLKICKNGHSGLVTFFLDVVQPVYPHWTMHLGCAH